jgi:hypothetical protein
MTSDLQSTSASQIQATTHFGATTPELPRDIPKKSK